MEFEEFSVTMRKRRVSFELRLCITDDHYTGIIHNPACPVPVIITGDRETTAREWFDQMLSGIEASRAAVSGE
jgi:hypothetical protein